MNAVNRHDRPLLRELAVAFVASLCGAALLSLPFVSDAGDSGIRAVTALLGFSYLLYVLSRSAARTGRVTVVVLWLAVAVGSAFAVPPLGAYLLLHIGMVSIVRSLYHHTSALTALADLGLGVLGAAFAWWAGSRTGSTWLALWCFFLVQAFFVLLPTPRPASRRGSARVTHGETFERARRAADLALRRLAERH